MKEQHAVVIGAGPAGIAMAISLLDRGIRPLVIDRAGEIASSWRTRYDRLKLNTGRQFSHLPGRPYPKGTPVFPTRDQVVAHLDRHARNAGIALSLNTAVTRIEQRPGGWRLRTSNDDIDVRHVVVATGMMHTRCIPVWPLATGGAAKVWMAVRTPPNIMRRGGPAGLPGDVISLPLYHAPTRLADAIARQARARFIGDLLEFGLPVPLEGPFTLLARAHHVPSLVDSDVIESIRDGSIEVVATVDGFDGSDVRLIDGRRLEADAVICATGYVQGLESLVGHLGVLDDRGIPRVGGATPAAPGLWFLGFTARPSLIGFVGKQSKVVAKRIAKELDGR